MKEVSIGDAESGFRRVAGYAALWSLCLDRAVKVASIAVAYALFLAGPTGGLSRSPADICKMPKDLLVLDDFPETPAGKLDREAMVKMLLLQ